MSDRPRRKQFVDKPIPPTQITATLIPAIEPFVTEKTFWKAIYGGRCAGKTESIARLLVLLGKERPLRILCAREIMKSIKDSVHHALVNAIRELGLTDWYTILDTSITGPYVDYYDASGLLKKRRTEFFFCGLKSNVQQIQSYHDIQICWVEEAANVSKRSWQILAPTIRRAPGTPDDYPCEVWVSFNPHREHDAVYEMFVSNPIENATIINVQYWDNPWFDRSGQRDKMEADKRRNYDEYLHIWEGHCLKYWEGQIYLNELKLAEEEGRICDVPYRADAPPCDVYFDIGGGSDATAIWIAQSVGDFVHVVDYHEAVQANLDYFLKWIEQKPYVVSTYFLPHDARARFAGSVMSYEQLVRSKGKKVRIVPSGAGAVAEGINALRTLFPRLRFDQHKCAKGLEALRNYRFELEDDEKGGFKSVPVHDRYSHGADAARYMAMAFRQPKEGKIPPGKYNPPSSSGGAMGWMAL